MTEKSCTLVALSYQEPDAFLDKFFEQTKSEYKVLWPAVQLLREAVICYKAEAYLACAILCRASLEALLHLAKTRTGAIANLDPDTYLRELKKWALSQGYLAGLETKFEAVRDNGDFGAHLAQKIDKSYVNMPQNEATVIQIWIDPKTAWNSIQDASEIIVQVSKKVWS